MNPRERCIKVLLRILQNPYRFTLKELAAHFGYRDIDTVKKDIKFLRDAGIHIDIKRTDNYRYAILPSREFKELKYLQPLTDEDKANLSRALDYVKGIDKHYLRKKIDSLYNFQQLGIRSLSKPSLARIDRLESARKQKKQAVLINYRSNSGSIKDRIVEVFHIDPELDTIQTLDVESDPLDNRHFLLSRIERVEVLEQPWQHENLHSFQRTDVFRIANNKQVNVELQLDIYAYNILIETYPKALSEISPDAEANMYFFQSKVNAEFKGITNYILGNAAHAKIEILAPESLRERVRELAGKILKNYKKKYT